MAQGTRHRAEVGFKFKEKGKIIENVVPKVVPEKIPSIQTNITKSAER